MATSFPALLKQAAAKLQQFDFGDAMKLYEEAVRLRPDNAAAHMGLAMTLNRTGQPDKALPVLNKIWAALEKEKAKNLDTTKAAVLAQTALALQAKGDAQKALTCFTQAYELAPTKELKTAIERLKPIAIGGSTPEALLERARALHRSGNLPEAAKSYKAALQLNGDLAPALHGLGCVFRETGDLKSAMPLVQQALLLQPNNAEYYNTLGMIFQGQGNLDKAVLAHRQAIKLDPKYAVAHSNLGVALKRLGRIDDAIQAYEKGLKLDAILPELHNNLGNLLRLQGKLEEARNALQKALALRPTYADAKRNLAEVEELLSRGLASSKRAAAGSKVRSNKVEKRQGGKRAVVKTKQRKGRTNVR